MTKSIYRNYIKRLLDLIFSLLLIVILSPVFLIIAIMIKTDDGGSVIYKQKRVGLNKKTFVIYKFRSMVQNADKIGPGSTASNDSRITRIGSILRKASLDELPQLFNILKGDMSFIGPRPVLKDAISPNDIEYNNRFIVRPGLSGLAQVNGRSQIDANKKRLLDIKYSKTFSFSMDLEILVNTVKTVLHKKGVN